MAIIWAQDPGPEPHTSRLDDAADRGFDPGEDQGAQRADGPITPSMARYNHQGSVEGCENCGERCDDCGDRLCATWGPAPRPCATTCEDCPCSCRKCTDQREDMRDELLHQLERDAR